MDKFKWSVRGSCAFNCSICKFPTLDDAFPVAKGIEEIFAKHKMRIVFNSIDNATDKVYKEMVSKHRFCSFNINFAKSFTGTKDEYKHRMGLFKDDLIAYGHAHGLMCTEPLWHTTGYEI